MHNKAQVNIWIIRTARIQSSEEWVSLLHPTGIEHDVDVAFHGCTSISGAPDQAWEISGNAPTHL
ncbi:hypothetical protein FRC02_006031, partial [Tulasnella sp. 418]